jgi:hypothetical protein
MKRPAEGADESKSDGMDPAGRGPDRPGDGPRFGAGGEPRRAPASRGLAPVHPDPKPER